MKLRRWFGAMSVGVAVIAGNAGAAWGQTGGAEVTIDEMKRLTEDAQRLLDEGKYDEAVPLIQRVGAIGRAKTAETFNAIAERYLQQGDYMKAEPFLLHVLSFRKETLGPNHPSVAMAMHHLANLYLAKGDYTQAEPLIFAVMSILHHTYGHEHPSMAPAIKNLAALYLAKRNYAMAEVFYNHAFANQVLTLGLQHPELAKTLNDLGSLAMEKGEHNDAEKHFLAALAIAEKTLPPEYSQVATTLTNLARLYQSKMDDANAESFCQRAFRILEHAAEPQPPHVANALENLALVYHSKGDHARAELLYRRVLAIRERAVGIGRPMVVAPLRNLAAVHWARDDSSAALLELDRAISIEDATATEDLSIGSAEQRRIYTERLRLGGGIDMAISLHVQAASGVEGAKRLAFRTILRRKGLALDAVKIGLAGLHEGVSSEDQIKLAKAQHLTDLYAAVARLTPGKDRDDAQQFVLQTLNQQRQMLENEVSISRKRSQAPSKPVTVEQVQAALAKDAVLVEIFRYQPFDPKAAWTKRWGQARFVAYVLYPNGSIKYADLGEAQPIEDAVKTLRNALSRAATDPRSAARVLYHRVMAPIEKLLGKTRHIYLSPDGDLSLVPFGAMMSSTGHYVAQEFSITYLTTGRELVRGTHSEPRQPAVVFAAPDYGIPTKEGTRQFEPLRAGAEEGLEVWEKLPDAKFYDGARATEDRLRSVHGPSVLHISTHGFFDKNLPVFQERPGTDLLPWAIPTASAEKALLRSGLAFAGANRGGSGNEDGLLTALEASQLDLSGTKLVVLSACETGMGQAENGDGVYGLRRAFTIAGAETVVMSLWRVDASATTDLVKRYYDGLSAGGGRAEALRQAQLAMLANPETSHPYYWASFIVSGSDSTMDGRPVTPTFGRVNRSGACGTCATVGASNADVDSWALLGVFAGFAIAVHRRSSSSPHQRSLN